jgi:CubicO group peptidase (beta-lactamase class C family)
VPGFARTRTIIERAIEAHVFPGAVIEVGTAGAVLWTEALGHLTYAPDAAPVRRDTLFDLASLTKVVATTTLAMRAVDERRLSLADRIAAFLPEWSGPARSGVTIRHVLAHSSGLPAWLPLFRTCAGRDEFQRAICGLPLDFTPGSAARYSDLGFILLGFIIADAAGEPLDAQFDRTWSVLWGGAPGHQGVRGEVLEPPLLYVGYVPPAAWRPRIAPTEAGPPRDRPLIGEAHDDNCRALGGVAGHAGLFGTAAGVGAFARLVLDARAGSESPLARPETVAVFTARQREPGSSRALGWDTMLPTSSCGSRMSPSAFGHTGFTGTSLWIDPDAGVYVVLLTNCVHPSREGNAIRRVRPAVHDSVMEEVQPT